VAHESHAEIDWLCQSPSTFPSLGSKTPKLARKTREVKVYAFAAAGSPRFMPWILKALLLVARSKRGRELLFAGALGAVELARSERARRLYGKARSLAFARR